MSNVKSASTSTSTLDSFVTVKKREAKSQFKSALDCLRSVFGYDAFRPGQRPVIEALLEERSDAFVLWSTGSGKSLTFQIPALMFAGLTVVVSPLIALMADQVAALKRKNVPAECYNSSQKLAEQRAVVKAVADGHVKLLYVSPERAITDQFLALLASLYAGERLSLFAVDESHCVSSWGHDFRPSYRRLAVLKQRFPKVPLLALTATATPAVVDDVLAQLQLRSPRIFRMSFNRPNVHYAVVPVGVAEQAAGSLFADMKRRIDDVAAKSGTARVAGIVYCHKRDDCDSVAQQLSAAGYRAAAYHSTAKQRDVVLADWTAGKLDVVVATIAFGMGIDKPDVRFVVHVNISKSLEAFYQESGRAGRDGKPSWSVLYASKDDIEMQRFLVAKDGGRVAECDDDGQTLGGAVQAHAADAEKRQKRILQAIDDVVKYTQPKCRRVSLLAHFGENVAPNAKGNNGGLPCCDFCAAPERVKKEFATQQRLDTSAGTGTSFGGATVSTTSGHVRLSQFVGARQVLGAKPPRDEGDEFYDVDESKPKRVDLSKASDKWDALEKAERAWMAGGSSDVGAARGAGSFRPPRPLAANGSLAASINRGAESGFSSALRVMQSAAGPMYSGKPSSAPTKAPPATATTAKRKTPPTVAPARKKLASTTTTTTTTTTLDLTGDEPDDGADEQWE
jgi:RecQ family ATP-dependent DNA helicase